MAVPRLPSQLRGLAEGAKARAKPPDAAASEQAKASQVSESQVKPTPMDAEHRYAEITDMGQLERLRTSLTERGLQDQADMVKSRIESLKEELKPPTDLGKSKRTLDVVHQHLG
eukprot:11208583-Alexandrium_andersonii.AAC.1